jgi:hypothetical protein
MLSYLIKKMVFISQALFSSFDLIEDNACDNQNNSQINHIAAYQFMQYDEITIISKFTSIAVTIEIFYGADAQRSTYLIVLF